MWKERTINALRSTETHPEVGPDLNAQAAYNDLQDTTDSREGSRENIKHEPSISSSSSALTNNKDAVSEGIGNISKYAHRIKGEMTTAMAAKETEMERASHQAHSTAILTLRSAGEKIARVASDTVHKLGMKD
jgi:hypothetical protein